MTDLSTLLQPDQGQAAVALQLVDKKGFEDWLKARPDAVRQAANAQGFKAEGHQLAILPDGQGWSAALGVADVGTLGPWCLAKAAEALPEGSYRIEGGRPGEAALGWLLGQYRFDRYKRGNGAAKGPRVLLTDEPARIDETLLVAEATGLVRDLVNIPTAEMGPAELENAARSIAATCSAAVSQTSGAELERQFPMIHAVGRAAAPERAPRLIELEWGDQRHPRIAIVGKGVCFDTGGLDIKSPAGMRLMKKDMGGAAHALGLALLIMKGRLPVRLHLLVPAVENAISGDAYRPGDVLRSRQGTTVEITNTDAEGRLVLADTLARAAEAKPELIIDFATLTGAARVALGPDLPALFANRPALADALLEGGRAASDPLWQLPLWKDYEEMFASDIADIANCSDIPMAGTIVAGLFLQKFVPGEIAWAHLDTFAWRQSARPGRPKGGDALGMRAAWRMLKERYGS